MTLTLTTVTIIILTTSHIVMFCVGLTIGYYKGINYAIREMEKYNY